MGRPSRNAEPALNAGLMRDQLGLPILGEVGGEGVIEGGDVIWLDEKSMAVGRGVRTNDQGIKQLKAMLGSDIDVEVIPLPEPRHPEDVFHLMMIISPLDADLALVDMDRRHPVRDEEVFSRAGWSPYTGLELVGWPVYTIVGGQVVFESGRIRPGVYGKPLTFSQPRT